MYICFTSKFLTYEVPSGYFMPPEMMTESNRSPKEALMHISTATIATCLFKKGLKNQFIQGVVPLHSRHGNMVGEAYTRDISRPREDLNPIEVFRDPGHLQRVAIEQCPKGHVLVIDSRKNARAASAGSILVSRLKLRGVAGIVTDGDSEIVEK